MKKPKVIEASSEGEVDPLNFDVGRDEDELEAAPFQSILPPGAWAWDQVLDEPLRFAPWPYTADELALIQKLLPNGTPTYFLERIQFVARDYVACKHKKSRRPSKANPHNELQRIKSAVAELQEALEAASIGVHLHLRSTAGQYFARQSTPFVLLKNLDVFCTTNQHGLRKLPEKSPSGGPPKSSLLDRTVLEFWLVWRAAHRGTTPARGWPEFRSACCWAGGTYRLPKNNTDKMWQTALLRAKKHFNVGPNNLIKNS